MQIAIDNAKRRYDIDLEEEISRIQADLDIDANGLPKFWQITKKDKRKVRNDEEKTKHERENRKRIRKKINSSLTCPMNYLYDMNLGKYRNVDKTLPMEYFFVKHTNNDRRKSKKVEELIEKYSLELHKIHINYSYNNISWHEDYVDLLLMADFDELISDIRKINISSNYLGLMSWLINRAFFIGAGVRRNENNMDSTVYKNRVILLKVLYTVNPKSFLECFTKSVHLIENHPCEVSVN